MGDKVMARQIENKGSGIIAGIIVALSIICVSYYLSDEYYFQPEAEELLKKHAKLDELKANNDENEKIKANANQLELSLASAEQQFSSLKSLVPTEEAELATIAKEIANKAHDRALNFVFFSQGTKSTQIGSMNEVPLQVEVVGYYDNVSRYVEDFARFERLLKVTSLTMKLEPKANTPTPQPTQQPTTSTAQPTEQISQVATIRATINFSAYVVDKPSTSTSKNPK